MSDMKPRKMTARDYYLIWAEDHEVEDNGTAFVAGYRAANGEWLGLQKLVDEQAADPGLWFIAERASEQYLQDALRELHAAIENSTSRTEGEK